MSDFIPPPRPYELLPPLLACLPTAFVSPRPPPALLPLLTPILRQRVHLLAATASSDNWLPLLSWDAERASKLPGVVEKLQIEPHPVSGEVEIEDPSQTVFRRLDGETLRCKLELDEYELVPIYLWCLGDGEGNEKGWMLAELRSAEDFEDGSTWYGSISEANEQAATAARTSHANGHALNVPSNERRDSPQDDDDDDSYWNAYDRSPGRTPSTKRTPPPAISSVKLPTSDELEYFARYMNEVQPALDSEDPDEPTLPSHESTLTGNSLIPQQQADLHHEPIETSNLGPRGYDSSFPIQAAIPDAVRSIDDIRSPRPSSSGDASPVEELEKRARSSSSAEFGIKQHISTDIKSLYRLARSAGIDRDEFERIVKTELEVLGFMDKED